MRSALFMAAFAALLLGCEEDVLHDLDEARANRARMVIQRAGISARKNRSGTLWTVSVPSADVVRALEEIERSRILVRDAKRGEEPSSGMVQSRAERSRAEEQRKALALEDTLEQIPGVLEARVHLQFAPESSLGIVRTPARSSAGVLLAVFEPAAALEADARRIVSGGSGVPAEAIAVVVSQAPPLTGGGTPPAGPSAPDRPEFEMQVVLGVALTALCVALLILLRKSQRQSRPRLRPAALQGGIDHNGKMNGIFTAP